MLAPCIACHKCWRSYTLPEWDLLRPITGEQPRESADVEHRRCECGEELSADVDFRFPDVLVIFQLSFGLKAQLYRGLYLLGEAGIWDGIILRGGLSYRF